MTNAGGVAYTWDSNGNLINDGSATYLYDRANRLISATVGGSTSLYAYNGDGARLKQIVAGVVTAYTQDIASPLPVVVQAKTGTTITQYLYALGTRPLAQNGGAWEYLLPDALGSVRQIVDANGNVTLAKFYEPYGTVLTSTGTASSIFAYAGEQADTTGLIYLRARYMNPRLGIFLARDPWSGDVLRPGSMNGWNYAGGNPIIRVDPSGRCYPPLAFLRDIEPAQCANMDQALLILGDPRSTREQRAGPGFYVGMWTTSHAMFVLGAGILAGGGVIAWGTRALATAGGAKAAQIVSEHPNFIAEIGNCAENTWNSAQQAVQQMIQDETGSIGGSPVVIELGSGDFSNLPQIVADNPGARVIGIESTEVGNLVAAGHEFPGGSSTFDAFARGYDAAIDKGAEIMFQDFGWGLPLRADKIISIAPNPSSVSDVVEAIRSAIKPGGEIYIATVPGESTGGALKESLSRIFGAGVSLSEGTSRYSSNYLPQGIAEIIHFFVPR